jgi:cyclophilin family peptidyl-prolyl cis-trans isomerase
MMGLHARRALLGLALGALRCIPACGPRNDTSGVKRIASEPGPISSASAALIATMRDAEASRSEALVPEAALANHDARVRRAATRALSRIVEGKSADRLERGLADEDLEVVAWAAFGLGVSCSGREPETVRALVARGASLAEKKPGKADDRRFALSPIDAIADALGRCGTASAEQTLRAWLDGPVDRAKSAALSLSRLAGRRHHLDDATTVALLDAAAQSAPLEVALAPFSRLDSLPEPTAQRLRDLATRAIRAGGPPRSFAIRALGSAGPEASAALADVLANASMPAQERSLAAAALGRLGTDAKPALSRALSALVHGATLSDERFLAQTFAPLSAALAALSSPADAASDALAELAVLPIPGGATPGVRRRLVALRCGAASILAGTASQSERLVHCDPDARGRSGALARLRVLDRGTLTSARFDGWKALAEAPDPAVRRAALALVPAHPEMPPITGILAKALGSPEPGIVAEAARVLATAPRRSTTLPIESAATGQDPKDPGSPAPEIVEALAKALDTERPPDQVETRAVLARAASRIAVLSLKPRVERLCRSENATLRRAAEDALRGFGSTSATCAPPKVIVPAPAPMALEAAPLTLTFVTDAGRLGLTLDPTLAPFAAARIADLARSGFYDGLAIQRVVPGFVVQLGDPVGDGYGGAGRSPLPSETSPLEVSAFSVGMAVGGRDTASSQVFVTLSPEPALYGDYPIVGFADPEWANAVEGDVIRSVEVRR